jgi:basic amino acid/polyamine antiporter, APA family
MSKLAPAPKDPSAAGSTRLKPVLGLASAVAIVVGGVIGSGVFLKPNVVAQNTGGFVGLILALWIVCGVVNLCGALALAELSAMMPHAGGSYVFLREAYGRPWGFAWAWAEFWVIRSGSTASLAAAMAVALNRLYLTNGRLLTEASQTGIAIGAIAGLAIVNIVGTRWGGAVQNLTTVIKVGFVLFLACLPFMALGSEPVQIEQWWPTVAQLGMLGAIGKALSGIMWAYDGWAALPNMSEEVRDPQRNVPRALIVGIVVLIVLYAGANLAYHLTLPSQDIIKSEIPAVDVAKTLLPSFGEKLTLAMMMVSIFGALNSNVLTGPRVLFAVARDHRFLGALSRIDPRSGTPALAIAGISTWAAVLVLAGKLPAKLHAYSTYFSFLDPKKGLFDILTDYTIFGASVFYLASVVAVFVLRYRRPDAPRPYRAWGYPLLPAIFVVAYVLFIGAYFVSQPVESISGLALIVAGLIFYAIFARGEHGTS